MRHAHFVTDRPNDTSYVPGVTIGSDASPAAAVSPNGPWALWHMYRYQWEWSSLHAPGVIPPFGGCRGRPGLAGRAFLSSGGFIFHPAFFYLLSGARSGVSNFIRTSSKPQITPQILHKSLVTPNTQIRPVWQFTDCVVLRSRKTSRTILLVAVSRLSHALLLLLASPADAPASPRRLAASWLRVCHRFHAFVALACARWCTAVGTVSTDGARFVFHMPTGGAGCVHMDR